MDLKLNNKNALVCGSTAGIGKATAIALAQEGVNITLIARNEDKLKDTLSELPQHRNHNYIVADFSNPEQLKIQLKEKGNYHILINNTGGPKGGLVHTASTDEFIKAFNMHIVCNQILVQACLPFMKAEQYGRIINIISTSVKQPIDGLGVSNTIRGAVGNWSKTLANELGQFGITVNNILPGSTETERLSEIITNKSKKSGISEADTIHAMKQIIPAKRFGKAQEIANAAVFLASKAASYINGINLPVDGGRTKSL